MKQSNLTICDATIHPGETASLALPLPEFYSCTSFYMPIKVVHGKKPGPCMLIFTTVKGDELNGLEIINRLLNEESLKNLCGTLITVPVLNVFGLLSHSKVTTYEHNNIEGCFPGTEDGSYGDRVAHLFTQEILSRADYCIELQTGSLNHDILPQVYCNLENEDGKKLAQRFAAPVITNVSLEGSALRKTTDQLNIPLLVYQAGEAMRFNEPAISLGLNGITNVMQTLEMIDSEAEAEQDTQEIPFSPIFSQDQDWIRSHRSGILYTNVELGQQVKQNQTIGQISDPFSKDTADPVKSPQSGVIVGINRHPLIHEGQTIFKIASFINNDRAESALEVWGNQQTEE